MEIQVTQPTAQGNDSSLIKFPIGQKYYLTDQVKLPMDAKSFIQNGRSFVPVRFLGNSLNAKVDYKDGEVKIQSKDNSKSVKLQIESNKILINGTPKTMDVVPLVKEGRTYLPARYVAEAFGYEVGFTNNTVTVTKPQPIATGPFEPAIQRVELRAGSTTATATRWDGSKFTIALDAAPEVVWPEQKYIDMARESGYLQPHVKPIVITNTHGFYIPFRSVAKAFGVPEQNIKWDGKTLKLYHNPDTCFVFTPDSKTVKALNPKWLDGELSEPAKVINGELMLIMRDIEALLFRLSAPTSLTTGIIGDNCGINMGHGTASFECYQDTEEEY